MSTSINAAFNVVSGNGNFVTVIFNIHGQKMRLSASSQKSISEKSIFGHFEVIFLTYKIFPGRRWSFPVSTIKAEYFTGMMSSLADRKKKLFNFPQKY